MFSILKNPTTHRRNNQYGRVRENHNSFVPELVDAIARHNR